MALESWQVEEGNVLAVVVNDLPGPIFVEVVSGFVYMENDEETIDVRDGDDEDPWMMYADGRDFEPDQPHGYHSVRWVGARYSWPKQMVELIARATESVDDPDEPIWHDSEHMIVAERVAWQCGRRDRWSGWAPGNEPIFDGDGNVLNRKIKRGL